LLSASRTVQFEQRIAAAFTLGVAAHNAVAFAIEIEDEFDAHIARADAQQIRCAMTRFAPHGPG
jgi:hypothetical protein